MIIEMNVDVEGLESMIEENVMEKTVTTPYPNKEIRVLTLSKIQQLPHCNLLVMREGRNKIGIDAINDYPGGGACWNLKINIKDKSYYGYFNKLLEEVGL